MQAIAAGRSSTKAVGTGVAGGTRKKLPIVPVVIVLLGLMLLGVAGAYYGYRGYALSKLDELNVTIPEPPVIGAGKSGGGQGLGSPRAGPDPATQNVITSNPRYWTDPRTPAGALDAAAIEAAGYRAPDSGIFAGPAPPATKVRVPAIGVDSVLQELRVINLGDSRAWETPKDVVGHIPTTATPGRQGQGWYFGHLESPLQGEGNVFSRLPEIPRLLRDGEDVYVFLEGPDRKYLYQVYKTEVVPAEELRLTNSGAAEITLVACYPRLSYSHRLLVTATLIGVQDFEPESATAAPPAWAAGGPR